jgi:hypothetical protein
MNNSIQLLSLAARSGLLLIGASLGQLRTNLVETLIQIDTVKIDVAGQRLILVP